MKSNQSPEEGILILRTTNVDLPQRWDPWWGNFFETLHMKWVCIAKESLKWLKISQVVSRFHILGSWNMPLWSLLCLRLPPLGVQHQWAFHYWWSPRDGQHWPQMHWGLGQHQSNLHLWTLKVHLFLLVGAKWWQVLGLCASVIPRLNLVPDMVDGGEPELQDFHSVHLHRNNLRQVLTLQQASSKSSAPMFSCSCVYFPTISVTRY